MGGMIWGMIIMPSSSFLKKQCNIFFCGPDELAWVTVDKAIELGLRPEVWPKTKKPDGQLRERRDQSRSRARL